MTVPDYGLGGRVPLFDPNELTREGKNTYDLLNAKMIPWANKSGFKSQTPDGKMIGPFNGFLLAPEITAAFVALQEAEQKHTQLTQRLRQVVILTVGAVWKCDYERYAHTAVARKAGLSEAAIGALTTGDTASDLSDKEQLAQRFTRQLMVERHIDDELFSAAKAAFGLQGIVDIIYLAGCYCTVSSLLNTFNVPAPE